MSEKKERITVSKFVDGYNKLTSAELKSKYIQKHITTTYAPLLNKLNILKLMNEKSVVEDPVKFVDLTVSKLNFVIAILVLYTDISPDTNDDKTPRIWEAYDKLKSTGILELMIENIGEDIEELMSVQKQVLDTWHMQNTTPEAYVVSLVEKASQRFGIAASVGMEKLIELLDDDKKVEKIMSALEKMLNKIK